jgi:hypothetical protein
MKTLLSASVAFGVVLCCDALANPIQDFISKIQGPGSNSRPSPPLQPDGAKLLQELKLSRSTEPVLAGARAQQIPNLLTASIPAVLRIGSGVFADGYQISLIDRDDTKYTYAALENRQIQETGNYKAPDEPLILYEFESCPFCRKVREACSSKYLKQESIEFMRALTSKITDVFDRLTCALTSESFASGHQCYHFQSPFDRLPKTDASFESKSRPNLVRRLHSRI